MSTITAVGVDAGGTGTLAVASRDGVATGKGCAGAANASSRGVRAAAETIAQAVREAAGDAESFTLFVGAAGAARPDVREELVEALRALLPRARAITAEDDARIALRAVIPEGPGIVLIAGTGSCAYAENGDARVRVGGAGYLLGDEGAGFAIGIAALRATVRVLDGRAKADEMTRYVQETLAAHDTPALLTEIYGSLPVNVARIARLAEGVLSLAGAGDRAAGKIVQVAARDLGDLACAASKQAGLAEHSPSIALSGGLFRENSMLTYVLQTRLHADIPGAHIVRGDVEPAAAALRFAEAAAAERVRP